MKKLFRILAVLIITLALVACGGTTNGDSNGGETAQGVTDTEILVGNTASTSGDYNAIGIPFSQMIAAVFEEYNDGGIGDGLINGRTINYIHYDDQSDAATGKAQVERLVETDKVFALVGHFGTWTVSPTVQYLRDYGIPMVHAATGTNDLYFTDTPGNPIMAIQPIYRTDGRVMTARAFTWEPAYNGSVLKDDAVIAVAYTDDNVGQSILAGVDEELANFEADGKSFEVKKYPGSVENAGTIAAQIKSDNVDSIIIASNQPFFEALLPDLNSNEVKAPIFTSYVNADVKHVNQAQANVGSIYMNGWYDDVQSEYDEFERIIDNYSELSDTEKADLKESTHAKSGYVAATTFIEGLRRVGEDTLSWDNFIAAMESDAIDLLLAGGVDYRNGQRIGTDTMSLWEYQRDTHEIQAVDALKSIPEIAGRD
jgi:ABC-type branched-subunit amino acid transport system substrate-binding protein